MAKLWARLASSYPRQAHSTVFQPNLASHTFVERTGGQWQAFLDSGREDMALKKWPYQEAHGPQPDTNHRRCGARLLVLPCCQPSLFQPTSRQAALPGRDALQARLRVADSRSTTNRDTVLKQIAHWKTFGQPGHHTHRHVLPPEKRHVTVTYHSCLFFYGQLVLPKSCCSML